MSFLMKPELLNRFGIELSCALSETKALLNNNVEQSFTLFQSCWSDNLNIFGTNQIFLCVDPDKWLVQQKIKNAISERNKIYEECKNNPREDNKRKSIYYVNDF